MKHIGAGLICIALLVCCTTHHALAIDGDFWETISAQQKEAYIAGLIEGALSLGAEALLSLEHKPSRTVVDNLMDYYDLCKQVAVIDIVNVLDRFYEDDANSKIWVTEAYKITLKMIRGYAEEDLRHEVEQLRLKSARTP